MKGGLFLSDIILPILFFRYLWFYFKAKEKIVTEKYTLCPGHGFKMCGSISSLTKFRFSMFYAFPLFLYYKILHVTMFVFIIDSYPAETEWLTFATSLEPGQLAHPCTCCLTRLYTVGCTTSSSHLNIPKNDNGQFQKWNVDKSIYEIQQIMVNLVINLFQQYRAWPWRQPPQIHAVWLGPVLFQILIVISPKLKMDKSKSERWTVPFKKVMRLRVDYVHLILFKQKCIDQTLTSTDKSDPWWNAFSTACETM